MKKILLIILAVIFIMGCDAVIECQDVSECEDKPHLLCNGTWSCHNNKCIYDCPAGFLNATDETLSEDEDREVKIEEIVVDITSPEDEEGDEDTDDEIDINETVVNETNSTPPPPPEWKSSGDMIVSFIDVEFGDAVLIITPHNVSVLVDGGPDDQGSVVVKHLREYGIFLYLDSIISTNSKRDYVGGLDGVMYNMLKDHTIKVYSSGYDPDTSSYDGFKGWANIEEHKRIKYDTEIHLDNATKMEFIVPYDKGWFNSVEENSMLFKLTYHNVSFLFTGSCGKYCEEKIIDKEFDVDILKVSNHGHKDGTSPEFLEKATPDVAIITAGDHHNHDEPHEEVLNRLDSENVKVYRTDVNGNIEIRTDGVTYSIKLQKETPEE